MAGGTNTIPACRGARGEQAVLLEPDLSTPGASARAAGPGILPEGTKKLQLLKTYVQQHKAFEERDYL